MLPLPRGYECVCGYHSILRVTDFAFSQERYPGVQWKTNYLNTAHLISLLIDSHWKKIIISQLATRSKSDPLYTLGPIQIGKLSVSCSVRSNQFSNKMFYFDLIAYNLQTGRKKKRIFSTIAPPFCKRGAILE